MLIPLSGVKSRVIVNSRFGIMLKVIKAKDMHFQSFSMILIFLSQYRTGKSTLHLY